MRAIVLVALMAITANAQTYQPTLAEAVAEYEDASNTYGDAVSQGVDELLPLADEFELILDAAQGTEYEDDVEDMSATLRDSVQQLAAQQDECLLLSNAAETSYALAMAPNAGQDEYSILYGFCKFTFAPVANLFSINVGALIGAYDEVLGVCETWDLLGDYDE